MQRLQSGNTHTLLAVANEQLHAFSSFISQNRKGRYRRSREGPCVSRRLPQRKQTRPEQESTIGVAPNKAMAFKCRRKTMSGGPRQSRHHNEFRQ
jgi:hypothetical protein